MKIKAGFYIQNYFDNNHETTATRKKKKKSDKQKNPENNCETLLSSVFFLPLEVALLKLAK